MAFSDRQTERQMDNKKNLGGGSENAHTHIVSMTTPKIMPTQDSEHENLLWFHMFKNPVVAIVYICILEILQTNFN